VRILPTDALVDDGGRQPACLAAGPQNAKCRPSKAETVSAPELKRGQPMSAVEKDDSESHKTRFAKDQLKAFVERIERLEEEKKTISDDIRDVYAESKANGFDVKALRQIIKLRKQDSDERSEQQAILETYMHALGMLAA
jgi:uncharacterized protein (UPF0335 family)